MLDFCPDFNHLRTFEHYDEDRLNDHKMKVCYEFAIKS